MKAQIIALFLLLSYSSTGPVVVATINISPGNDFADAISSANSGDTVFFNVGAYKTRRPIVVPSGVTVMGASAETTEIVFDINGGDEASYGFVIPANGHDVTIEELSLRSNHGLVAMELGNGYKNIVISRNELQYGTGELSDGTLVYGISGTILNDGLQIVHNYFHDTQGTVRNWCIFFATNANLDYNEFYNINDGGQLLDVGPNVSFSFNYGTRIHRMGQEVSLIAQSTFGCTGNVFYDFVEPYFDTEGVSIVGESGDVDISNNYFSANIPHDSTWGQADEGGAKRFGYAIECTGEPCHVTGNTLVGTWAECVSSDIKKARVEENSVFGSGLWGDFNGEPGPFGYGSIAASNNQIDRNISDAPSPPANTHAGPRNHST